MRAWLAQGALYVFEQIIRAVVGMTIFLLYMKALDPPDFGALVYAISIFGIINALNLLGLDAILLNRFHRRKVTDLLRLSITMRFALSICLFFSLYILSELRDEVIIRLVMFFSISSLFDSFLGLREYAHSRQRFTLISGSGLLGSIIAISSAVWLIESDLGVEFYALPFVAGRATFIAVLICAQADTLIALSWARGLARSKRQILTFLRASGPLLGTAILGLLYTSADRFWIGSNLGLVDVGIYAAAIRLTQLSNALPTVLSNYVYRNISAIVLEGNTEKLLTLYCVFCWLGFLSFLALVMLFWSLGGVLFPDGTKGIELLATIYALTVFPVYFNSLNNKLLVIQGLQAIIQQRMVIGFFILCGLFGLFIPEYGLMGAAWSAVLTEFLLLILYYVSPRTRHMFWIMIRSPFHLRKLMNEIF